VRSAAQQALRRATRVPEVRARLHKTTPRAAVALLGALVLAGLLSACGSSSPSAQSLVNDTFSSHSSIESGQVDLSLGVSAAGSKSSTKPLSVRLSGPFQNAAAGRLPRFSLQASLTAAGHTLQAGATSTGSGLFVELAGTWFAAPESTLHALQQGYEQATKKASSAKVRSAFASLGIEPAHWLSNPVNAGTATVGGVATYHLTADLNTAGFLADVSKLSQSGGALGLSSSVPGASSLSPTVVSELAKSVKSAHVDIYTGKSDHLLRRLDLIASVTGTPQTQSLLGGLSSATVTLQLRFTDLNKPQTIAAPANPKPFSELLPALQQLLGALPGAGSSAGSSPGSIESLLKG